MSNRGQRGRPMADAVAPISEKALRRLNIACNVASGLLAAFFLLVIAFCVIGSSPAAMIRLILQIAE